MPSTEEELDRKTFLYNLLVPVMNKYVEGLDKGRCMYLLFVKPEIRTASGLVARPVLTSYYKSRHRCHRTRLCRRRASICRAPPQAHACHFPI